MIFNSLEFLIFLPVVFAIYWLLGRRVRLQNAFVVGASYLFYGWWDWRFLFLIAFTTVCSFFSGVLIDQVRGKNDNGIAERKARAAVAVNILINLGVLGLFKYYNFFVESLARLFHTLSTDDLLLHLILPVGISFYTFQALSYSIDVYRRKIEPTRDVVAFFAFVSFFPQLVAGPIERATNLLPQFLGERRFDYRQAVDGMRQILWGMFKKVLVADRCALFVNMVWDDLPNQSGSALVMGAIFFSFQIYGDFSGYSDIAIGTAKLFGIRLMRNFHVPYLSRDIAEFWRRWHISLTSWFRDYIYIPLGGSRVAQWKVVRNTFVIFLVSGLWHGANWTYIVWGLYHALLFVPLLLLDKNRRFREVVAEQGKWPSLVEVLRMVGTFALVTLGWIIFRAPYLSTAVCYVKGMLMPSTWAWTGEFPSLTLIFVMVMLLFEWFNRKAEHGLALDAVRPTCVRLGICYAIVVCILLYSFESEAFIYFQF